MRLGTTFMRALHAPYALIFERVLTMGYICRIPLVGPFDAALTPRHTTVLENNLLVLLAPDIRWLEDLMS